MEDNTYTISEISRGIESALSSAFSDKVWVVGEIQGLDRARHGKHWYFQLCENRDDGEVFRLSSTIWYGNKTALFGPNGKLRSVIDPEEPMDGMKIRALCKINFYAPYGKISLIVEDIDPTYTLGDLEAKRLALIEKLTKEGTLLQNRSLTLDEVPLRIGLITSIGSAAYNDFMKELEKSGVGFNLFVCDARMQGEKTVSTVRAAFYTLLKKSCDAIALIRGGGSRLDLSWFDREEIVRTIINCPVPVITGIGHEIDVTVCEMAAYSGLKTPTAAAVFLVKRVQEYLSEVYEIGVRISRAATDKAQQEENILRRRWDEIISLTRMLLLEDNAFIRNTPGRLVSSAGLQLAEALSSITTLAGNVASGRHIRRLENLRMDLSRSSMELTQSSSRRCEKEEHFLELASARVELLDPVQTLKRGYALVRDKRGELVKSVESLAEKDRFYAILRDGKITADIKKIEKEGDHDRKEKRQLEIWRSEGEAGKDSEGDRS